MNSIDLLDKFTAITNYWEPKIIAELNGQYVKLAKIKGEFVWHHHETEDELFQVVKGHMQMHYRDRVEEVGLGQIIVVPKGIEHKPVCEDETWIMLFEPKNTLNTGNASSELKQEKLDWI